MTDQIPASNLALVSPGVGDTIVGVQNGELRRFPMPALEGLRGYSSTSALNDDLDHPAGTLAIVTNDASANQNGLYRKTGNPGEGSWVPAADRVSALEQSVSGMLGGASVSDQQLKDWTLAEAFRLISATRDSAGVITSASIAWPDGSAGTFTATTINSTHNVIDAFTVTHAASGRMVTQAAVTRDSAGNVTAQPALSIGDAP